MKWVLYGIFILLISGVEIQFKLNLKWYVHWPMVFFGIFVCDAIAKILEGDREKMI